MKKNYFFMLFMSCLSLGSLAQVNCFNIEIDEVIRDPYNENYITVHILNPSFENVGYPGIRIYNSLTDELIGEEVVNFFGIGTESTHLVPITLDIVQAEIYNLRIEIWSGFYDTLECSSTANYVLYPEEFCTDSEIIVGLVGVDAGEDPFILEISQNGELVFSDSFILDSENSSYFQAPGTCLGIGCYDVTLTTSDAVISTNGYIQQQGGYYYDTPPVNWGMGEVVVEFSFSIFECATNSINEFEDNNFQIYPNPANESIILIWGKEFLSGDLNIHDLSGKLILSENITGFNKSINVKSFSSGMYIATIASDTDISSERFIVE